MNKSFFLLLLTIGLLVDRNVGEDSVEVKVADFPTNETFENTARLDGIWFAERSAETEGNADASSLAFGEKDELLKQEFVEFDRKVDEIDKSKKRLTFCALTRANGKLAIGSMDFDDLNGQFHLENLVVKLVCTQTQRFALVKRKYDASFWFVRYEISENGQYVQVFEPSLKEIKKNIALENRPDKTIDLIDGTQVYMLTANEFKEVINSKSDVFSKEPSLKIYRLKTTISESPKQETNDGKKQK